jgi:uncharacterized membrane protein YGL010W
LYFTYLFICRNQWIHIVCVPIILWTALVWVAGAVGPLVPGLDLSFGHLPCGPFVVNGAFLVITVYAAFYVILEPVAGVRRRSLSTPFPSPQQPHLCLACAVRCGVRAY